MSVLSILQIAILALVITAVIDVFRIKEWSLRKKVPISIILIVTNTIGVIIYFLVRKKYILGVVAVVLPIIMAILVFSQGQRMVREGGSQVSMVVYLKQVQTSLKVYHNDFGRYPPTLTELQTSSIPPHRQYFRDYQQAPLTIKQLNYRLIGEGESYEICVEEDINYCFTSNTEINRVGIFGR